MTDPAAKPQPCWFQLTPGRFVLALLAVEVLLWLSERFGWLAWHKGYAVLTGVAVVGLAMLLILGWFVVALVFRRRFQFSLRSLLSPGRRRGFAMQLACRGDEKGDATKDGSGVLLCVGLHGLL